MRGEESGQIHPNFNPVSGPTLRFPVSGFQVPGSEFRVGVPDWGSWVRSAYQRGAVPLESRPPGAECGVARHAKLLLELAKGAEVLGGRFLGVNLDIFLRF